MPDAKAFIVTDPSSGVGAAPALSLARLGWRVAINFSKSAASASARFECN
jgi:NAD(P)-dependent dehydrogenase (short-subunit alcohol dehydrogenase family)